MMPFVLSLGRGLVAWLLIDVLLIVCVVVIAKIRQYLWSLRKSLGDTASASPDPVEEFEVIKVKSTLVISQRLLTEEEGRTLETLDHAIDYLLNEREVHPHSAEWNAYTVSARMLIQARETFLKEHPAFAPLHVQLWKRMIKFIAQSGISIFLWMVPYCERRFLR